MGFEPKIYRTIGEHANQYTTDAVVFTWSPPFVINISLDDILWNFYI